MPGFLTRLVRMLRPEPLAPVMRTYRFVGGPMDGQTKQIPAGVALPGGHFKPSWIPQAAAVGGGVWAAADAWPGVIRYAFDGWDGGTAVMMWRYATGPEIEMAQVRRSLDGEEG